jgi:protein-disulfide isomerase
MTSYSTNLRRALIGLALSCAFLQWGSAPGSTQTADAANPPSPEDAIQKTIHDYILAHPEVLIQSLRIAKAREEERLSAEAKTLIASFRKDLFEDESAPVRGNPAGNLTLVEFFDYRCPYCRQLESALQTLVKSEPQLRIVEKEFPILGPASVYDARVALAARKQGKNGQLHDALMAKKTNLDEAGVLAVAQAVGLDLEQLKNDMSSPEIDAEIRRTAEIAKALKLKGTPAFIVGTELVPGATDLSTLRLMLEEAREGMN